jgi:predicted O-linked N-acetylglucosamine transferase (SPINDLY family)
VGVSVLHAAGYPDWLARSEDDYVAIAQRLAANRAALASQREQLRPRMLASALCDAAAMAKRLGDAIERIARERHVL